jgi:hypothetical protein
MRKPVVVLLAATVLLVGCSRNDSTDRSSSATTTTKSGVPGAEAGPGTPGGVDAGPEPTASEPEGAGATQGSQSSPQSTAAPRAAGSCSDGQKCIETKEGNRQVSVAEAKEWWPYPPILLPATSLSTGSHEHALLATSQAGGTKGDPKQEIGQLYLLRYPQGYQVKPEAYYEMMAAGGLSFRMSTYPKSQPLQSRPTMNAENFVEVRGERAGLEDSRKSQGGENFRMIYWFKEHPDGTQVMYLIGSDPTVYTVDEVIAWANSLKEN